jgi:hypothetical protein
LWRERERVFGLSENTSICLLTWSKFLRENGDSNSGRRQADKNNSACISLVVEREKAGVTFIHLTELKISLIKMFKDVKRTDEKVRISTRKNMKK